jgi:hypothetical protein
MTDRPVLVTVEPARLPKSLADPKRPEWATVMRNGPTNKPKVKNFICVSCAVIQVRAVLSASREASLVSGSPGLLLKAAELRSYVFCGITVAGAAMVFGFLALHRIAKWPGVAHVPAPGVYICTHMRPRGRYGAHLLGMALYDGAKCSRWYCKASGCVAFPGFSHKYA